MDMSDFCMDIVSEECYHVEKRVLIMDYLQVTEMADALEKRLERLIGLEAGLSENEKEICRQIDSEIERLSDEIIRKRDSYIESEKNAVSRMLTEMKSVATDVEPSSDYTYFAKDLEANRHAFLENMKDIEQLCAEMNNIDFNDLDKPVTYSADLVTYVVKETVAGQVSSNAKERDEKREIYSTYCKRLGELLSKANALLKAIERCYRDELNIDDYIEKLRNRGEEIKKVSVQGQRKKFENEIVKLLSGEDEVVNVEVLERMQEDGAKYEPNYRHGSQEFSSRIKLGELFANFAEPSKLTQYRRFIKYSPRLSKILDQGSINSPMILNLRKKGNILIDEKSYDGELSKLVKEFIHQYIQSFLLMQPSGRVNLCLIDCSDQCKFNRYTQLKNINPNALLNGIVRDERNIDRAVYEVETSMFGIGDNISTGNAADIFEFNQESFENPQSIHLLVLLDFPGKYSIEAISHIEKIVTNGNSAGVFSLIVRNKEIIPEYGSRQGSYDSAIRAIEKNCVCLVERTMDFSLDSRKTFKPLTTLPGDGFAANVMPILDKISKNQKNTVIPLEPMFELSDRYNLENTDLLHASKLIEIPIGKTGGVIRSLKFDTTGGNPHALVIGGTGSGKSNLLHTIILNGAYRYSPRDLQIYLIDFKGGVEFKFYEAEKIVQNQLPHIALTGLTSEPEDGVAILMNIRRILHEREDLFRRYNVKEIEAYNKLMGEDNKIPRVLVIIDEIQELFSNERLGQQAVKVLGELFKKGRSFGISILWASQTVPRAVGGEFKTNVLSQIGNRISLKVNNVEDARELGIPENKIRAINRPENGLGIIFDGSDYVEFRVAYAGEKDTMLNYVHMINEKWEDELKRFGWCKQLYVVGDDEVPLAEQGPDCFKLQSIRSCFPKSRERYMLSLGQDFICGEPYQIPILNRASRENLWIAGKDVGVLRDIMGYALLSVALENFTNEDIEDVRNTIYCFNGEFVDRKNELLFALPDKLGEMAVQITDVQTFVDKMVELFKLRKRRYADMAKKHEPIFVFIHCMQILGEMFAESKKYVVSEHEEAKGTSDSVSISAERSVVPCNDVPLLSGGFVVPGGFGKGIGGGGGDTLTFAEIMRELFLRGSDAGIHFIISMDNPTAIPELRNEMKGFVHKVIVMGANKDAVSTMTDNYLFSESVPNKHGVAFDYNGDDMSKFKMYRYDSCIGEEWLEALLDSYKK